MTPTVHLLSKVQDKLLLPELQKRVQQELGRIFPQAAQVTVQDLIEGFTRDRLRKIVLAVEVHTPARGRQLRPGNAPPEFQTHIVKLGARSEVEADGRGWQDCAQHRPVSQRMFVPVRVHDLGGTPQPRAAAVYQDASQWYGMLTPQEEEVATLDWAIVRSVLGSDISLDSVDRVLRQVLRELGRCFYTAATVDGDEPARFYRRKLKLPDEPGQAIHRWRTGRLWELRRDVVWLLCGQHAPDCPTPPEYHDPYDFIRWALARQRVPATLVGPAHGDLHPRNVIVGVAEGEIEFPLIIDYGDMSPQNVIAWDFAKLEMETKVRLLGQLLGHEATCRSLWERTTDPGLQHLVGLWKRRASRGPESLVKRTQQIVAAAELERQLNAYTAALFQNPQTPPEAPGLSGRPLARARCLLQRIRYEAANQLGRLPRRLAEWRDEYYFALAVYGLNTAKFDDDAYQPYHRLFALISAGMATAQLRTVCPDFPALVAGTGAGRGSYPGYCVPLYRAYTQWKANQPLEAAERLLSDCAADFDYAVPLRREHALLLAKRAQNAAQQGRYELAADLWQQALDILERIALPHGEPSRLSQQEIIELCRTFGEIEVFSRLGRIYKDKADLAWQREDVAFDRLEKHPAAQFYDSAFQYYHAAFLLTEDHYPGGNAAVTALLAGKRSLAKTIARQAARICRTKIPANQAPNDRYWVLATEGDLALIGGDPQAAAGFFRSACDVLPRGNDGMVQSSYDQLCRLYRALGATAVRPVVDVFRKTRKFRLSPGPLGDCGGTFSRRHRRA